jgi:SAM-dependent methyltransferase
MPSKFTHRSSKAELLDAPHIPQQLLFQNLHELEVINRLLGGHAITMNGIKQLVTDRTKTYVIADIGCGGGDALVCIANWARKNKFQVKLLGLDRNADAIAYLNSRCHAYREIRGIVSSYEDFFKTDVLVDIVHCSLFCHHLTDTELTELFMWMQQNTQTGFIINDLHRHWLAYYSIKWLTRLLNGSVLVKNDAPLSVLRGFKKQELQRVLHASGIIKAEVKWKWAFRYLVVSRNNASQN